MKRYKFGRSVTVSDALVRDADGHPVTDDAGRPTFGPRAFEAGDTVRADELHPGTVESCVRVGHLAEVPDEEQAPAPAPEAGPEPEPGPGLVELPAEDQAPPAAPAKGKRK